MKLSRLDGTLGINFEQLTGKISQISSNFMNSFWCR